jgi:hypothetical protein
MGKCESATVSIGIKIVLSDLVLQINEINFELIQSMLDNGCIEDENDYFNEVYSDIVCNDDIPKDYLHAKEYLIHAFTHNGTYHKARRSNACIPTLDHGCLFDQELIVPVKKLLSCERWGYERMGTNSTSRPIDFDLSFNTEPYKSIEKTKIVFILKQHSG